MKTADRKKWRKLLRDARALDAFTPMNSDEDEKKNRCVLLMANRGAAFIKKHPEYFPVARAA